MRRECPVVAVTAFSSKEIEIKRKTSGISFVLTKPVSFIGLKRVI